MPYARSPNASIPNKQWGSHGAVIANGLSYCLFFLLLLLISLFSSRSEWLQWISSGELENMERGSNRGARRTKNGMLAISNQHSKCIEFALLDTFSLSNSVDYSTKGIPQMVKFCLGSEKNLHPVYYRFACASHFQIGLGLTVSCTLRIRDPSSVPIWYT